jgi:hypothetical protein
MGGMAKAYFSTVFEQTAGAVWGIVRDFGNDYWWTHEPVKTVVEDGKSGYEIGAIRHVRGAGFDFRQRLVAISDTDRFFTYEFAEQEPDRPQDMQVTIRVTPIVDGDRAFVEWFATFDCPPAESGRWRTYFENAFAGWLGPLRDILQQQ